MWTLDCKPPHQRNIHHGSTRHNLRGYEMATKSSFHNSHIAEKRKTRASHSTWPIQIKTSTTTTKTSPTNSVFICICCGCVCVVWFEENYHHLGVFIRCCDDWRPICGLCVAESWLYRSFVGTPSPSGFLIKNLAAQYMSIARLSLGFVCLWDKKWTTTFFQVMLV